MNTENYQYYYGIYNSFTDIEKVWKKNAAHQYSTNDIKVFYNGIEIPRRNVIDYVLEYPDLVLYLNHKN